MVSGAKVAQYERLNGKYLREAEELLRKKDLPQASEKLWGAVAEMIKAVAARRGEVLGTHRSLVRFLSHLDDERPDLALVQHFGVAEALHINFYEDHLPEEVVQKYASVVKTLMERLRALL